MSAQDAQQARVLRALEAAAAKLEEAERRRSEPLAIVGMSCRFPGAPDPEAYWKLLVNGTDAVTEVPPERFDIGEFFDTDSNAAGATCSRSGGFLPQVDRFDAEFFGLSKREADIADPQQRLLLEVTCEAFERAGFTRDELRGTETGVFTGITGSDYGRLSTRSLPRLDAYHVTGNSLNAAAGRVAYQYGLQGPAMAVDTACSSSLAAVHLACQSLRARECDLAVAGGVNLALLPDGFIALAKAGVLSPDGRCRAFDAAAGGMGRAEGCGVILLKRVSDAIQAGDEILAVVRGSAMNQDGASAGLTVPSGPAQEAVVKRALANARLEAAAIGYVEAHGTGTPLGDPIELRALGNALGSAHGRQSPLVVGSVKANIGHAESAAGMAGLIKAVLCLRHGLFTPQIHFETPTPKVNWAALNLRVTSRAEEWPASSGPRRAGISGFGFSGTNVHVIVEQAPPALAEKRESVRAPQAAVLPLSAVNEAALREMAQSYAALLRSAPECDFRDVCYSAATGRDRYPERAAFVAGSRLQLIQTLEAFTGVRGRVPSALPEELTFVFPGEGQFRTTPLYETEPVFRAAMDECLSLFAGAPPEVPSELFAFEYALARLWQSWGIQPSAVWGDGIGACVAECIGGEVHLERAVRGAIEGGALSPARQPGRGLSLIVGPGPANGTAGSIASLDGANPDLARALAALFVTSARIDWKAVYKDTGRRRVPIPTYPFQRTRCWFEESRNEPTAPAAPLYRVEWMEQPLEPSRRPDRAHWILLSGRTKFAAEVARAIEARGETVEFAGRAPLDLASRRTPVQILHLGSLEIERGWDLERALHQGCLSGLELLQQAARGTSTRVWMATAGAQLGGGRPLQAALWGLARVAALEMPHVFGGIVDLDPEDWKATQLLAEIGSGTGGAVQAAYRNGKRLVPRLQRGGPSMATNVPIRADRSYLITGGTGGLGLELARWLTGKGAKHLFLASRREPDAETRDKLGRPVHWLAVDLADFAAVERMVARIDRTAPLGGFLHAAAALDDAAIGNQSGDRFRVAMAGKASGALHLDRALGGRPLDFAVFFSSLASITGSPGQANYAAANAVLDALAEDRARRGLAALSIQWGPWLETGLAARLGDAGRIAMRARGLEPLSTASALHLLEQAIATGAPGAVAAILDFEAMRRSLAGVALPVIDRLSPPPSATQAPVESSSLLDYLAGRVETVMRSNGGRVPLDVPLQSLGLDSVMAAELKNGIARELGLDVPIGELLTGSTILTLADSLSRKALLYRTAAAGGMQSGETETVIL